MRSLQEKFGGLFGGGGSKGSNDKKSPGGPSGANIGLLIGVAALIWLATGIYIVDEGNRGVILRFGQYHETTLPGPHWRFPSPIDRTIIVNVDQQRFIEIGYRSEPINKQRVV